jgi:hypothetical protein
MRVVRGFVIKFSVLVFSYLVGLVVVRPFVDFYLGNL